MSSEAGRRKNLWLVTVVGGALITLVVPLEALARTQHPAERRSQVESAIRPPAAATEPDVPPLTSNRPGIGDSEALVSPGAFQIEAGVMFQDAQPGGDRRWTQSWGQFTLRYGVTRRIEIFGGWDGLSLDRVAIQGQSRIVAGGNDLRVGTKLAVLMEQTHGLTVTLAPAWSFPVGSEEFTSGSQDPSLRVLWARSLPRDWSVSGNLLWVRTSDPIGRYWETGVTIGLTRDLTDSLSAFVEGSDVLQAVRPDSVTIDGGLAWAVGLDLQLDVSVGHTLNDRGDDWFVSTGITLRRR